jgi:hypothetical protein
MLSNHLQHGCMLFPELSDIVRRQLLCQGKSLGPVLEVPPHLKGGQRLAAAQQELLYSTHGTALAQVL